VPAVVERSPDSTADLTTVTPMRIFSDLAVAGETGLLRFEIAPHVKEVYLVRGSPESINSSLRAERFGEYLVARGYLRAADLQTALTQLPRFSGKLGDTLVGLGLMKPLDVFRLLSDQVRERVMDIFGWVQGSVAFWRGVRNPQEAFPLGLDPFEILGAGVLNLPYDYLERRSNLTLERRPRAFTPPRINPEGFRLGPTPRDLLSMLDGSRTVRDWMARFTSPDELVTFLRTLYLLTETGLVAYV
jgi:serine/threonine-protein kinase